MDAPICGISTDHDADSRDIKGGSNRGPVRKGSNGARRWVRRVVVAGINNNLPDCKPNLHGTLQVARPLCTVAALSCHVVLAPNQPPFIAMCLAFPLVG